MQMQVAPYDYGSQSGSTCTWWCRLSFERRLHLDLRLPQRARQSGEARLLVGADGRAVEGLDAQPHALHAAAACDVECNAVDGRADATIADGLVEEVRELDATFVDRQQHDVAEQLVVDDDAEVLAGREDAVEPGGEVLLDGRKSLRTALRLERAVHRFERKPVVRGQATHDERPALAIDQSGGQRYHVRSRGPSR